MNSKYEIMIMEIRVMIVKAGQVNDFFFNSLSQFEIIKLTLKKVT